MKPKQLKNITISLAIITTFFLGRESKQVEISNRLQPYYFTDTLQHTISNNFKDIYAPLQSLENSTIVYRCGQSKIYHPTKSHASFKRCKSTIYELTVERAKELGMRHCKCID